MWNHFLFSLGHIGSLFSQPFALEQVLFINLVQFLFDLDIAPLCMFVSGHSSCLYMAPVLKSVAVLGVSPESLPWYPWVSEQAKVNFHKWLERKEGGICCRLSWQRDIQSALLGCSQSLSSLFCFSGWKGNQRSWQELSFTHLLLVPKNWHKDMLLLGCLLTSWLPTIGLVFI